MTAWTLDPRLEADTHAVARLGLSELRLMDERRWPWLVLVPRVAGARELVDLDQAAGALLLEEIARCSRVLRASVRCDKLNVAALGNVVEQLHVHVIARTGEDPAWPRPVWGVGERQPLHPPALAALLAAVRSGLGI